MVESLVLLLHMLKSNVCCAISQRLCIPLCNIFFFTSKNIFGLHQMKPNWKSCRFSRDLTRKTNKIKLSGKSQRRAWILIIILKHSQWICLCLLDYTWKSCANGGPSSLVCDLTRFIYYYVTVIFNMSWYRLGEMFEADFADTCAENFRSGWWGAERECRACADTGARTPIGVSGNCLIFLQFRFWQKGERRRRN